jgi:hypothetical protein
MWARSEPARRRRARRVCENPHYVGGCPAARLTLVNVNLLIDNIVRQTTVLVAQLATAAGGRAPLAHVAGQVFVDLVSELKAQGLGNKVIADMFGLTLRTYHDRVRRASESKTERGVSLWEAVLRYARQKQMLTRAELLRRFSADDEASVRGVLSDLVESGILFKSGRADHTTYRAASEAEQSAVQASDPEAAAANMVWVLLHQSGPLDAAALSAQLSLSPEMVSQALEYLLARGRCRTDGAGYRADHCVIPYGDELGWEAALFDHFQAVVTAIGSKVARGKKSAAPAETTGGSTYHFDLHRGHPAEREVLELLRTTRERASALRAQVEQHALPPEPGDEPSSTSPERYRVVFYVGQNTVGLEAPPGESE